MAKVAFLGLGVMGFPMAGYLAKNGHEVTVCNRTRAKADAWVAQHGGRTADTPQAAVQGASIVFSCVGDDPDLRAITVGANGAGLPVTEMVNDYYGEVQKMGGGRWDTSSLIRRLGKN